MSAKGKIRDDGGQLGQCVKNVGRRFTGPLLGLELPVRCGGSYRSRQSCTLKRAWTGLGQRPLNHLSTAAQYRKNAPDEVFRAGAGRVYPRVNGGNNLTVAACHRHRDRTQAMLEFFLNEGVTLLSHLAQFQLQDHGICDRPCRLRLEFHSFQVEAQLIFRQMR